MGLIASAAFTRLRLMSCAGLFLSLASSATLAADPRCQQLEELHRQYRGVSLTSNQQALKRKLLSWYNANCRARRASR